MNRRPAGSRLLPVFAGWLKHATLLNNSGQILLKCVIQARLALRYRQMISGVAQRVQGGGTPRVVQALRSCRKCAHDREIASAPICFGLPSASARDRIIDQPFMYTS